MVVGAMIFRIALGFLFTVSLAAQDTPEWMWIDEGGDNPRVFVHEFILDKPVSEFADEVEKVALKVTADFAAVDVVINGTKIAEIEPYDPVAEFEIIDHYIFGLNRIELIAYPVEGPSAIAAMLPITKLNG